MECQYDDSPDDPQSQPPVKNMSVGVSKQAIFLITLTSPPVILRQPYNRIVKWVSHKEMNIFCYWILKSDMTPQKVEEMERERNGLGLHNELDGVVIDGEGNVSKTIGSHVDDPGKYCDCVYLVSEYTEEIELVFSSYLELIRHRAPPLLPGDEPDDEDALLEQDSSHRQPPSPSPDRKPPPPPPETSTDSPTIGSSNNSSKSKSRGKEKGSTKRASLFSKMFMSSTVNDEEEVTLQKDTIKEDDEEEYNMGGIMDCDFDDLEAFYDPHGEGSQQQIAFQNELFPPLSISNVDILNGGTGEAQVAATMEELNNLTFKDFLEDDEDDDEEEDEDSDNSSKSAEVKDITKPPAPARRNSLFKW